MQLNSTIYYLEMRSISQLKRKSLPLTLSILENTVKQYPVNQFLYRFVGSPWQWTDKLSHTSKQWKDYAEAANLRTWIAYYQGAIAGYYELQQQLNGDIEIKYFGLTQQFTGKGFGSSMLSHAIEQAWLWEGSLRVWVNTCTKDHPSALHNYQKRGMHLYKKVCIEEKKESERKERKKREKREKSQLNKGELR